MGKIQILTKEQELILDCLRENDFLRSNFFFTGGTALSEVYLRHRYSEDLDFFSNQKFDNRVILSIVDEWSKKHSFSFQARFTEIVYVFNLLFKNGVELKVDFVYHRFKRIETGKEFRGVSLNSKLDIAIQLSQK